MRDENCWPYLVEQSCVCIRIDFKINRPDSRCHLPEILIESIFVTTELHPVEKIRPNTETKTDEQPELYEWTRRLYLMRKWAQMLNELGGNVTVVHLPEAGLHGNTHFPFSDLNNIEVADLLSAWLHEKDLD